MLSALKLVRNDYIMNFRMHSHYYVYEHFFSRKGMNELENDHIGLLMMLVFTCGYHLSVFGRWIFRLFAYTTTNTTWLCCVKCFNSVYAGGVT